MVMPKPKTKEEIFDTYARRLSSKGKNRNQMLRMAKEFLDYAEGNYERATVEGFLSAEKEKRKYGPGSLNYVFRLIRTLYGRSQMEWPFNRSEAPVVRESRVVAPALGPNTSRRAISIIKASDNIEAAAFFALSTVYGLRQQEMVNLTQDDVRIKDQTIYIATLKHGRERTHIIPDQIVYYLSRYDFSEPRSEMHMWNLWGNIERMAEIKHIPRVGWHAVRRCLDTLLTGAFDGNKVLIGNFLRWKQGSDMVQRYSRVTFVGDDEGDHVEIQGDALNVDQRIFTETRADGTLKHPFLSDWE